MGTRGPEPRSVRRGSASRLLHPGCGTGAPPGTRGAQVSPKDCLCEGCAAPAPRRQLRGHLSSAAPWAPLCAKRQVPAAPPERPQAQPQNRALGQNERLEGSKAERETTYLKTNKQQTEVYQSLSFNFVAQCPVAPLCYVVSWKVIFTYTVTRPVDSPTLRAPSASQKDPECTVPSPAIRGSRTRTCRAASARCHQVAFAAGFQVNAVPLPKVGHHSTLSPTPAVGKSL